MVSISGNSVIIHVGKECLQGWGTTSLHETSFAASLISMLEPSVISRNPSISTYCHSMKKVISTPRPHFLKAEIRDMGELNTLADKATFPGSLGMRHKILAALFLQRPLKSGNMHITSLPHCCQWHPFLDHLWKKSTVGHWFKNFRSSFQS